MFQNVKLNAIQLLISFAIEDSSYMQLSYATVPFLMLCRLHSNSFRVTRTLYFERLLLVHPYLNQNIKDGYNFHVADSFLQVIQYRVHKLFGWFLKMQYPVSRGPSIFLDKLGRGLI